MVTFEQKHTTYNDKQKVLNQPPPLVNYNLFTQDTALVEGVKREGAGWAETQLTDIGDLSGKEEVIRWGFDANENLPVLHTHDRYGNRIDEVRFHPAWHALLGTAVEHGLHASPWRNPKQGTHVARAAAFYIFSQVESGHSCPISMTYAAVPALRTQPEIAAVWEPQLTSLTYDPGLRLATSKQGILCGMGMTEKQGGSDVRANITTATPIGSGGPGAEYVLTGHKWFCSAPMCDVFLVLAQAPRGPSCFLLPRVLPDGTRNNFFIQRLKDKLGNRSNASSEIELDAAWALLIGEEGRGVQTIIEMVNYTRLDCVLGSASLMRQAVVQALHHATYRHAFGQALIDQPLMRNVLADLALESEAATTLALRLAHACDHAATNEHEALIKRLGTAIAKYWVSKRTPIHTAEALECLGGNGFVEESIMPRLYREAPLNSIWEGSGNVNCLDVLRAMRKEPRVVEAFFSEVTLSSQSNQHLQRAIDTLQRELQDSTNVEYRARYLVEQMALVLQSALLLRDGNTVVADAFCTSRLGGNWGRAFGTMPTNVDVKAIIAHARPVLG